MLYSPNATGHEPGTELILRSVHLQEYSVEKVCVCILENFLE